MPQTDTGILLIVGAIFLLIGLLGGGVEIAAAKIPSVGKYPRIFLVGVGVILMGIAIGRLIFPPLPNSITVAPTATPIPSINMPAPPTDTPIPPINTAVSASINAPQPSNTPQPPTSTPTPVPTLTPIPIPDDTPTSIPTATRDVLTSSDYESLLYEDNFDTDTSMWSLGEGSSIQNGELIIAPSSWASPPTNMHSNLIFEEEFRFINPEVIHYTTVYLRMTEPPCPGETGNCSNQVFVSSDRNIAAWRYEGGSEPVPLMAYTKAPQLDPNGPNKLTVIANGSEFQVFINDVFVRGFTDPTYDSGKIVLDADKAATAINYIRIYALP